MTVHPGTTPWQAIVITYPAPNYHTNTWQQSWEDIRGDLLQEHLGLTRIHTHPPSGVRSSPSTTRHEHAGVMGIRHTHEPTSSGGHQDRTIGPASADQNPT